MRGTEEDEGFDRRIIGPDHKECGVDGIDPHPAMANLNRGVIRRTSKPPLKRRHVPPFPLVAKISTRNQ
jgi:hypothetical protein